MTKPASVAQGATFDLEAVAREIRNDDAYSRSGHAAQTLVRTSDLRVVLVAMRAGAIIAEHQASQTAAIHVIAGRIRLALPDREVTLGGGELLGLAGGLRHDVAADQDSAFLLTLGHVADPG